MRKIAAILSLIVVSLSYGYAQRTNYLSSYATQSQAQSYFENNLLELDEIEGVYDVSMIPKYCGGNMLSGLRHWGGNEYSSRAFIAKQSNGKYVCNLESGRKVYIQGNLNFERLGTTNAYRVTGRYSEYYDHFGNSGTLSFNISTRTTYQYPAFTIEFQGNNEFHMVEMLLSFVKVYPDAYAIQKRIEIESTPTEWSGTGFALKDGYIITNHHVIDGAKSISIYGVQGNFEQSLNATVIATDAHNDLALLKVTDSKFNGFGTIPYAVKNLMAEVGEEVFVLGYPMTQYMGSEIKLTNGLISSRSGFQGDISTYQISAPVQPGNSGGPLFDKKGNIVGVVNAGIPGAENVGYAIKVSYMNNLIETAVSTSILPTINQLTNLKLSQQVSKVKDFVYYIECSSSEKETYVKQSTSVAQSHSQSENSNSYNATSQTSVSGDWISFYNSGLEKAKARDYEGAYKDFCKSCECERNEKNEYLKSYVAVQLGLWEEAYQSAKFAVDNGNDDADNVLAVAAQNTRRYDEAIRQYTKIIDKNAQDVWAIHGRAWCYELTKDWEKCIADCRMALKYEKTEDFDYSSIYNELAWALVNVNKPADALDPIKKAIKLDHTQGNYWDTEAEAKYKTGDYIGCISSATNAIAIGKTKDNASWLDNSYYWRGMAKKQIGDMAGAFQDLESSIECAEDDEDFETKAQSALSSIDASIIDFSIGNFAIKYENLAITKQREDKILLNIVELTSDYTALYLEYKNTEYAEGGWYNISKDAYVRDKATGKKYRCIATENCAFAPYQTPIELNETKIFILYFEALPESANKIDFIESTTSDWQFYDIILK